MINYSLGKVVMTNGISSKMAESKKFSDEIMNCFKKYMVCDWDDMCNEDKEMNDNALRTGTARVLASYDTSEGKVYIITEQNRSYTTILFANEYW